MLELILEKSWGILTLTAIQILVAVYYLFKTLGVNEILYAVRHVTEDSLGIVAILMGVGLIISSLVTLITGNKTTQYMSLGVGLIFLVIILFIIVIANSGMGNPR